MERMKLQSLVITRGRDGMVAFDRQHKPVDIPIFGSDQVTDVTGAGDTVIATFTAALGGGRNHRRGGATGELRWRHRRHEARHRDCLAGRIAARARTNTARHATSLNGHTKHTTARS